MRGRAAAARRAGDAMTEVLFYHLTERGLEDAAPEVLEKCLARGWRAVVRAGSAARVGSLDARLWTCDAEGFLPHGTAADGNAERQPVYLTAGAEVPNDPDVLVLVDGAGATASEMARFARVALMFDGHDPEAVEGARAHWRAAVAAGFAAVYWAQEGGRWVKRRESPARAGAAPENPAPEQAR